MAYLGFVRNTLIFKRPLALIAWGRYSLSIKLK